MMLSDNISLREMTKSATARAGAIDNTPPIEAIDNLRALSQAVLQPIRNHYCAPLRITSGYRCLRLNRAVGGAKASQHVCGEAADISLDGLALEDLMAWIVNDSKLPFDQVILEPNWIHIAFTTRHDPRYEALLKVSGGYKWYGAA